MPLWASSLSMAPSLTFNPHLQEQCRLVRTVPASREVVVFPEVWSWVEMLDATLVVRGLVKHEVSGEPPRYLEVDVREVRLAQELGLQSPFPQLVTVEPEVAMVASDSEEIDHVLQLLLKHRDMLRHDQHIERDKSWCLLVLVAGPAGHA